MDVLVIGGHFSHDRGDSLRHTDDYRLHVDDVPMTFPNLVRYFNNGRQVLNPETYSLLEYRRPYRQIYWSGLHLQAMLIRLGWDCKLLHCHDVMDASRLRFFQAQPKIVAISTTFLNMKALRAVAEDVREHCPNALIIAGGALIRHSFLVKQRENEELYAHSDVREKYAFTSEDPIREIDVYVVDTHGENALANVVERALDGKSISKIDNTVERDGKGGWRVNSLFEEAYNIAEHRICWSDMPRESLGPIIPFQNTYGCPFKCSFCNFSLTKVHKKSMGDLMDEFLELAKRGITETVWFTDDNFLLNEKLVVEFCNSYLEIGAPFRWKSFIRASSISPKTAELMKKARCSLLMLGLESGSQTILNNMQKQDTVGHYSETINTLVEHEIDLDVSFILGFPGESADTIKETAEFISNIPFSPRQVSYLYLFTFNVVPLSPVFEQSERDRFSLTGNFDNWSHSTMRSDEVSDWLQYVATNSGHTVFNYIDAESLGLDKPEAVELMRMRDMVARETLRSGPTSSSSLTAWDLLENQMRHKVPDLFENNLFGVAN